jgi:hypothetical protein
LHIVGLFVQINNAVAAIKFERKAEGTGVGELLKSVGCNCKSKWKRSKKCYKTGTENCAFNSQMPSEAGSK